MRLVRGTAGVLAAILACGATLVVTAAAPAGAAPEPSLDLARPRILGADTDPDVVRARLDREPYRTIFGRLDFHAHESDGIAADDHTIGSERIKTKTTKDLAYVYALDRTIVNGTIVPFPSAAARTAAGDSVRDHLLTMYTRSRLAVAPPLGGTDRDINTSEELLQYATAYDTMLGAGYDFGASDAVIRTNLTDLAAELYRNYTVPETANSSALVLPNNHRSKSAAALGVAALALFDAPPAEGTPPADERAPAAWLAFALDQVDIVQRWTYVAPGGGYGEGPYYQRYASQNLLPFTRAWDHVRGNRPWDIGPRSIPDLWRQPAYRATQRWMLDLTLPDGGLAPIDDGNIDFTYYFGLAPVDPADAPAFVWRCAHAPTPYDTDGSVDLSADALANFDDAILPAEPSGSPTRLDDESGTAVFRSDWSPDAVEVVAVGEHGAAMELGRDRDGLGQVAGAAHEQPDTASYLMHAFGERLLLDPGYLTYEQRGLVGKAPDHNLILVNGKGPADPFLSSIFWVNDRAGLPPNLDGQATITGMSDTASWDRAQVTSAYAAAKFQRRFEFVDNRYLVTFDAVTATPGDQLTWVTHGNGGGTSGGAFTPTATGGRWEHGAARVDTGLATSGGPLALTTRTTNHEGANRALLTHTALDTTSAALAPTTRSVAIAYPTRIGEPAPVIESVPLTNGRVRLRLTDTAGDRVVIATQDAAGHITIRDRHLDGTPRSVNRDSTRTVSAPGGFNARRTGRGRLGVTMSASAVDVVAPKTDVELHGLPFVPHHADGACNLTTNETGTFVRTARDGAVTLSPGAGNSAPAADPGPDVENAAVLTWLHLDAAASCDANHDALTAHWQLLAAPAGSAWVLADTEATRPWLALDRPGPYRVRLTVTDSHGAVSRASDLTVFAGPRCIGDRLTWSDPRC